MDRCFVIQPFDHGPFDKRYEDVVEPAIRAAGLEPYRVDRDPSVTIPIEHIEENIRGSRACVAEISTDNANVWYELGFAVASNRDVVLLASREARQKFPFDIQHRSVILYAADSPRDFTELESKITARLSAILKKQADVAAVSTPVAEGASSAGLSAHEMAALVIIGTDSLGPGEAAPYYVIKRSMNAAGFTDAATAVGTRSLLRKDLVTSKAGHDENGEPWVEYALTPRGEDWLLSNQDKLVLRIPPKDSDIPF